MEQSQYFELVCTLSAEERSRFLLYLESSYANNGRFRHEIPLVTQMCWAFQAAPDSPALDKKQVFQQLFPGQTYADGRVEKLLVDAQKTLRTFLLSEYYHREDNEFKQSLDFAEIVRQRGLVDRYQKLMIKLRRNQEDKVQKGTTYYFNQFLLEDAICYVEALNNKRKGDLNIPNLLKAISEYYYTRRLELLIAYMLQKKVIIFDDRPFMQKLLEGHDIFPFCYDESVLIRVNSLVLSILRKKRPDLTDVYDLFSFFQDHGSNMDLQDMKDLSTHLRNFCSIILNNEPDNIDVLQLLFKIQQDDLYRGFMYYEGKIGSGKFRSIATLAISLKKFDWAEKFIEDHKDIIRDDNETRDVYRFIKALYLLETGQYEDSFDILPNTSPVNDILIACKRLELRVLYELNSDLLPYRMDAFKMYLHRTSPKLHAEGLRKKNHQFHILLQQIIQCPPSNSKRVERLIQRVRENRFAADWA